QFARLHVGLARQQLLQVGVEAGCLLQELDAQLLELLVLEQRILANAGMERGNGHLRQLEPRLHVGVLGGQLGVGPLLHRQHRPNPPQPRPAPPAPAPRPPPAPVAAASAAPLPAPPRSPAPLRVAPAPAPRGAPARRPPPAARPPPALPRRRPPAGRLARTPG